MPALKLKVTFNIKVEIILKVNIILHFIVINSNFFHGFRFHGFVFTNEL